MNENEQEQEKTNDNQENKNVFEDKMKDFFSWQWIVIMAGIIILVIVGFLYFRNKINSPTIETSPTNGTSSNEISSSSSPTQPATTSTSNKNSAENQKTNNQENNKNSVTTSKTEQKQPISQQIQIQGKTIIVSAAPGDGITQLARRALSEYIKQHPDTGKKLTREHRVYIEDYLKDQIVKQRNGRKSLEIGEKISFSTDLIQNAIQSSQKLTQKQLDYLKTFSQRINWSNI
ncbi:MAG TPA: hypothetical protein ENL06_03410 [Candidatus Portnoybacteria bacterium]|nr:hypothetical protein [Candidatus Portnoybacteria bacterium]